MVDSDSTSESDSAEDTPIVPPEALLNRRSYDNGARYMPVFDASYRPPREPLEPTAPGIDDNELAVPPPAYQDLVDSDPDQRFNTGYSPSRFSGNQSCIPTAPISVTSRYRLIPREPSAPMEVSVPDTCVSRPTAPPAIYLAEPTAPQCDTLHADLPPGYDIDPGTPPPRYDAQPPAFTTRYDIHPPEHQLRDTQATESLPRYDLDTIESPPPYDMDTAEPPQRYDRDTIEPPPRYDTIQPTVPPSGFNTDTRLARYDTHPVMAPEHSDSGSGIPPPRYDEVDRYQQFTVDVEFTDITNTMSQSHKTKTRKTVASGPRNLVGELADDDAICEVCMGTSTGQWVGCDMCPAWMHYECLPHEQQHLIDLSIVTNYRWKCNTCLYKD